MNTEGQKEQVWAVVEEAKRYLEGKNLVENRVLGGGRHRLPQRPEDYLAWLLEEAAVQHSIADQVETNDEDMYGEEEQIECYQLASLLRGYAIGLLRLGVAPPPLPNARKTGQEEEAHL